MNTTGKGTFAKGKSGNPGGRPKTKVFRNSLLRQIGDGSKNPEELIDVLWREGLSGNIKAIELIKEWTDGKTPQPLSGDEDQPLFPTKFKIEWSD